jgi:Spy/CpxP family protein refolding chaperone
MKSGSLFLSLFAAGLLSTQVVSAQAVQTAPKSHHRVGQPMLQRLTAQLNLTSDQQAQAKTIFQQSHEQMKAIAPQLRAQREAMAAAVKSGNEPQIDQVAQQNVPLEAQARAIHAKAMAKFYQILTADQKTKFDQMKNRRGAL